MSLLLRCVGLRKSFGHLRAVDDVALDLPEGIITAVIGPNGAGKTTLVNLLTGRLQPDAGRILFAGEEITGWPVPRRVHRGIGRSFQITNIFPRLSVAENISLAVLSRRGLGRRMWRPFAGLAEVRQEAEGLLREVGLQARADAPAGTLSHGDQRLLEIGISLATRPRLLFLDEPTAGLNPAERVAILEKIRALAQDQRVTFVVVEHDMDLVFALAGRIVVLHRGRVLAEGPPGAIRANLQVREVYLGEGEIAAAAPARSEALPSGPSPAAAAPSGPSLPVPSPAAPTPSGPLAAISPRAPAPAGPVLELQGVDVYYGQSHVLHGLSLRVARGEVVGLLGRNGAGKTTTLRAIMGLTPPRRGVIRCRGTAIAGWPPYDVARLGIGFVPDDRRIFPHLTTRENLELALVGLEGRQGWTVERVYELFPVLRAVDRSPGGALSGGEQKMLAIGRALMAGPELLLLDEPSEGLAPMVIQSLVQALRSIRELGVTILVADQNAKFARAVIDRCYIIDRGVIRYEGTMAALWEDRETLTRYLAV